jgi:glycosyltransferase involved in cell wall biosynthesis
MPKPTICFLGWGNLPALAPEFAHLTMGGAELQQCLLAKGLVKRGFEVSMVVYDLGQPDGTVWDGVRTYKCYDPAAGIAGLRFVHPRWTLVHSALKRAKARLRYTSCAGLPAGMTALYTRFNAGRTVFRISSNSDCDPRQLMIPNGSEQQRLLQDNYGLPSEVLPSLADVYAQQPVAEREVDVVWVSNLRLCKRPDRAMDLAEILSGRKLQMIGGEQTHEEQCFIDSQQRAQGINNLQFTGPLPLAEVNQAIANARVLINTSDMEGFPNTFLQAWTRGTPVVTFFDPDGVIKQRQLGIVVSSIAEMRAAIESLLGNTTLWAEYSQRCQNYVNAIHGDGALDRYADMLRRLHDS